MFKKVEIEWIDSCVSLEVLTPERAIVKIKPLVSKSVGYLIHKNNDYTLIAFIDYADSKLFKNWLSVPNTLIKNINEL